MNERRVVIQITTMEVDSMRKRRMLFRSGEYKVRNKRAQIKLYRRSAEFRKLCVYVNASPVSIKHY